MFGRKKIKSENKNLKVKRNRCVQIASFMLAIAIMCVMSFVPALAKEKNNVMPNIDESKSLSLTIKYYHDANNVKTLLSNVNFKVCKVADLNVKNGAAKYTLIDDFKESNIKFENMTASESNDVAKKLNEMAMAKKIDRMSKNTNAEGIVTFESLTPGMYLVVQPSVRKQGKREYISDPFLVSVPLAITGNEKSGNIWQYDVEVSPKSENSKNIVKPPKPPQKHPNPRPKTGDPFLFGLWGMAMLISGVVLANIFAKRKKNR